MSSLLSTEVVRSKSRQILKHHTVTILTTAVLSLATAAMVVGRHGSWNAFMGHLRGEVLLPNPRIQKLGPMLPGSQKELEFQIQNLTDERVTIVGLSTS